MSRKTLKKLFMLFLVIDVLIAAVLMGFVICDNLRYNKPDKVLEKYYGITKKLSQDEREEKMAQAAGEASRYVTLRSETTVDKDGILLYLSNSEENKCAVSVEVLLMGTEDVIACSELIEPGWRLESIELLKELEAGEHYCIVRCAFYTMEGNVFLGNTAKQLLLRVN